MANKKHYSSSLQVAKFQRKLENDQTTYSNQ